MKIRATTCVHGCILLEFIFCVHCQQESKYPKKRSLADDTLHKGQYTGSGIIPPYRWFKGQVPKDPLFHRFYALSPKVKAYLSQMPYGFDPSGSKELKHYSLVLVSEGVLELAKSVPKSIFLMLWSVLKNHLISWKWIWAPWDVIYELHVQFCTKSVLILKRVSIPSQNESWGTLSPLSTLTM